MDEYNTWRNDVIIRYCRKREIEITSNHTTVRNYVSAESARAELRAIERFWEQEKPEMHRNKEMSESGMARLQCCLMEQRQARDRFARAGIRLEDAAEDEHAEYFEPEVGTEEYPDANDESPDASDAAWAEHAAQLARDEAEYQSQMKKED